MGSRGGERQAAAPGNGGERQVAVLGIGSRLMGDDGVGNYVVEELWRREAFPGVRLVVGETDIDYCLDELESADVVILIDAARTGATPGTVTVFPLETIFEPLAPSVLPHDFNLLHGMRTHRCEKEGVLIAIEAASVTYRLGLSTEIEEKLPRITDKVAHYIERYLDL